jgi:hypothetical protein
LASLLARATGERPLACWTVLSVIFCRSLEDFDEDRMARFCDFANMVALFYADPLFLVVIPHQIKTIPHACVQEWNMLLAAVTLF